MIAYEAKFTMPTAVSKHSDEDLSVEDGGQALILDPSHGNDGDPHFFVRLHSWHDGAKIEDPDSHPLFRSLLGKRIRVIIEVLDDEEG
jgi:hypothetical protein